MGAGPRSFPLTHGSARRVEWQATPWHSHTMQKRRLGRSDLYLTLLALGTWAIGGPWAYGWGAQDDAESVATIDRALGLGVGWIETAPAYGLGHAETLVGRSASRAMRS
jgi:aryl-alcohol dehydrogenase-like predicted oxidoreductase